MRETNEQQLRRFRHEEVMREMQLFAICICVMLLAGAAVFIFARPVGV